MELETPPKEEKWVKLEKFKSKYMVLLSELKKELLSKYPESRVEYIVDTLIHKVYALDFYTLADFLHTLYLACKEMRELCRIMPTQQDIDKLLEEEP